MTFVWKTDRGGIASGVYPESIIPPEGSIALVDLWSEREHLAVENRHLRKAHLRRMVEAAPLRFHIWYDDSQLSQTEWWIRRRKDQYRRFVSACLATLERMDKEIKP